MKEHYKRFFDEVTSGEMAGPRNKNDKVLIVDGMNTFIRVWSSIPTMNDNGDHVAGVTNSLMSIGYAIKQIKPTRVIVVFDGSGGAKSRQKIYPGYKASRGKNKLRVNRSYSDMMNVEEERESMKRQFMWLTEFLHILPVTTMIYDGIEADDVMAYVAGHLLKPGEKGVIMSTDKDFLQMVNEDITVWSPTKKIHVDSDEVIKQYGIQPHNLLLYRVLDGDTSDEIPGVKGCGLKTVHKRFPELCDAEKMTVDGLLELAEERSTGKVKLYKTILESKEQILLNRRLMQLEEPEIAGSIKMNILTKFDEPTHNFSKIDFMKVCVKYGVTDKFTKDMTNWLNLTYSTLVTDAK